MNQEEKRIVKKAHQNSSSKKRRDSCNESKEELQTKNIHHQTNKGIKQNSKKKLNEEKDTKIFRSLKPKQLSKNLIKQMESTKNAEFHSCHKLQVQQVVGAPKSFINQENLKESLLNRKIVSVVERATNASAKSFEEFNSHFSSRLTQFVTSSFQVFTEFPKPSKHL